MHPFSTSCYTKFIINTKNILFHGFSNGPPVLKVKVWFVHFLDNFLINNKNKEKKNNV